jgi:hypothetical protein
MCSGTQNVNNWCVTILTLSHGISELVLFNSPTLPLPLPSDIDTGPQQFVFPPPTPLITRHLCTVQGPPGNKKAELCY